MSRLAVLMVAGLSGCAHTAEPTGLSEAARDVAASSRRVAAAADELSGKLDRLDGQQRAEAELLGSFEPVHEPVGGIACPGSSLCRIDRSYLDELLSPPFSLASHARAVPYVEYGTQKGFTLFDIAEGSLPKKLQFKNGDRIVHVSGTELNSTDAAMGVFHQLGGASSLEVGFIRKGKPLTLAIEIR